jgi:hypothetical protein
MASAVRTERAAPARRAAAPTSRRAATAAPRRGQVARPSAPAGRPALAVVPRRGRAAGYVVGLSGVAIVIMLGAAAFQTQLARRQVTLDVLDRQIRAAHDNYDVLRRERAELRSPGRLVEQATLLGMTPPTQTEYVEIGSDVLEAVQRAGAPASADGDRIVEEFAGYASVKATAGRTP